MNSYVSIRILPSINSENLNILPIRLLCFFFQNWKTRMQREKSMICGVLLHSTLLFCMPSTLLCSSFYKRKIQWCSWGKLLTWPPRCLGKKDTETISQIKNAAARKSHWLQYIPPEALEVLSIPSERDGARECGASISELREACEHLQINTERQIWTLVCQWEHVCYICWSSIPKTRCAAIIRRRPKNVLQTVSRTSLVNQNFRCTVLQMINTSFV